MFTLEHQRGDVEGEVEACGRNQQEEGVLGPTKGGFPKKIDSEKTNVETHITRKNGTRVTTEWYFRNLWLRFLITWYITKKKTQ